MVLIPFLKLSKIKMLQKLYDLIPTRTRKTIGKLIYSGSTIAPNSKKVLFWEPGGLVGLLQISSVIATALRLRGVSVHLVMCDSAFIGCIRRENTDNIPVSQWSNLCASCIKSYQKEIDSFLLPYSRIGSYVSSLKRQFLRQIADSTPLDEVFIYRYKSIDVGRLASSSIVRFYKGKTEDWDERVVREYFYSALVTTEAAINAYKILQPDYVFMSQTFYADWGPVLSLAVRKKIPVTILTSGYLPSCFYFSTVRNIKEIDSHRISDVTWEKIQKRKINKQQIKTVQDYIQTRYQKGFASDITINSNFQQKEQLIKFFNFPVKRPLWCLFTHINWDEVFNYTPMAYQTVNEWVLESIRYMIHMKDVNWIIKIHPAEVNEKSSYTVGSYIRATFSTLPAHVQVISADEHINTLSLLSAVDGGISICGTVGLELSTMGKPVILAGLAHYGHKGFTHDAYRVKKYLQLLKSAHKISPLTKQQIYKAQAYAYSYFIERQIPLDVYSMHNNTRGSLDLTKVSKLLPGKDPAIDMACDQILKSGDFVLTNNSYVLNKMNP